MLMHRAPKILLCAALAAALQPTSARADEARIDCRLPGASYFFLQCTLDPDAAKVVSCTEQDGTRNSVGASIQVSEDQLVWWSDDRHNKYYTINRNTLLWDQYVSVGDGKFTNGGEAPCQFVHRQL